MIVDKCKKLIIPLILLICLNLCIPTIYNHITLNEMPNSQFVKYDMTNTINSKVYAETVYKTDGDGNMKKVSGKDYSEAIEKIKGGTSFEKLISKLFANMIGALMGAVTGITGMKSLDGVVFNVGQYIDGFTPIDVTDWAKIKEWYVAMIALSTVFLFISILIVSIKFVKASGNVKYRQEAISSLKRVGASAIIILLAPIVIHLLLYINNNMVNAFYSFISGGTESLNSALGGVSVINSLEIDSPLAGVLILGLFSFLTLKINILFMIRSFNIIVYTIFTPFAATLWIMDENINGAKVWIGELLSNIFMQMSYAFVFALYLTFMGGKGWLVQLVWGNLIMAIADVLRNMFQGRLTELSGLNESKMAGSMVSKGFGAAASIAGVSALGGTAKAFGAQMPNRNAKDSGTSSIPTPSYNENESSNKDTVSLGKSQTPEVSPIQRSINTGNKAVGMVGKAAKVAFTAAAMPIAVASGDPQLVNGVKGVASGIEGGINAIGKPIGRAVAPYVQQDLDTAKTAHNKFIDDKVSPGVKDTAKLIVGKDIDDILKFR